MSIVCVRFEWHGFPRYVEEAQVRQVEGRRWRSQLGRLEGGRKAAGSIAQEGRQGKFNVPSDHFVNKPLIMHLFHLTHHLRTFQVFQSLLG